MRIFSYLIGIIFILFAVVQLNDPDMLIWVFAYMTPAMVAFLHPHRKINPWLLLGFSAIYLVAAILQFPPSMNDWIHAEEKAKSLSMTLPGIEEARESMGLFICFLALIFFWYKNKKKSSKQ